MSVSSTSSRPTPPATAAFNILTESFALLPAYPAGVILEQGRHEELLAIPNGGYARLVAAQMKGGK